MNVPELYGLTPTSVRQEFTALSRYRTIPVVRVTQRPLMLPVRVGHRLRRMVVMQRLSR